MNKRDKEILLAAGIIGGAALLAWLLNKEQFKCPRCNCPVKKDSLNCPNCGQPLLWGFQK